MLTQTFDHDILRKSCAASEPNAERQSQPHRLASLDVLRGLAVAAMILVTDPGTYSAVYPQLLHSQWNGATATDMIFPTFLFSVGVAITLSMGGRIRRGEDQKLIARHILFRSLTMFLLGLVLNGFPDYNLHTLRIPGVLQRIALCYLFAGFVYIGSIVTRDDSQGVRRLWQIGSLAALILIGYWAVLRFVPVPGFGANRLDSLGYLGAYLDRAVFRINHLWPYGTTPGVGVTYDPEGILSTVPAIATTLIGVLAGEVLLLKRSLAAKILTLGSGGLVLFIAGVLLNPVFPINKRIWTSTFVLVSGGVSLMFFAALLYFVDLTRNKRWTTPFLVFGTNAILAFAMSNIITTLTDRIRVGSGIEAQTFHQWADVHLFASWLPSVNASLAYALAIVLLNLALLWPLYRRRIFVRI